MTVYVVFHSDIEDDKYVRAVAETREKAQAIADNIEPCAEPYAGHQHRKWLGDPAPTDATGCYMTRDHFTQGGTTESLCCGVEEWEVV